MMNSKTVYVVCGILNNEAADLDSIRVFDTRELAEEYGETITATKDHWSHARFEVIPKIVHSELWVWR